MASIVRDFHKHFQKGTDSDVAVHRGKTLREIKQQRPKGRVDMSGRLRFLRIHVWKQHLPSNCP